jgi:uncharacterized repeat protein (TIGR03803 family)
VNGDGDRVLVFEQSATLKRVLYGGSIVKLNFSRKLVYVAVSVCALLCLATRSAEGQIENTLHSFTGGPGDGSNPYAGLIADSSGNFYGTTNAGGAHGFGTVFELVNSSGSYSEQVLYSFAGSQSGSDGASPYAGLIMDSSGNLYGTTLQGGPFNEGIVFELVNSSGTYSEKVLYGFTTSGGAFPYGGVIIDGSGNLYGTTQSGGANFFGTVFELVNSAGTYSEQVLYSFTKQGGDGAYPSSSLIVDGSGNLYGTTQQGGANGFGTVFELVNSSGTYTEQVLYSFTNSGGDGAYPYAGLIIDGSGNLYGTTQQGGPGKFGTVFELVNSSGSYSEKVLYGFSSSNGDGSQPGYGSLIMDSSGDLFGTTSNGGALKQGGTVFELVNSSGTYTESVLYSFGGGCGTGLSPYAGLVMDLSGNLYGTTTGGGSNGLGTVFSLNHLSGSPVPTTTTLTSSINPATAGELLQLTANVMSSYGPATGTVTFSEGSAVLGTQTLSCGTAILSIPDAEALGIGTYTITAQYNPNVTVLASSSTTLTQTVNEAGVVLTNGNNTLNGNQTIDGSVSASSFSASSFVGNGSALTGVTASGLSCTSCIGNMQLGINYAASTSQGGAASNALMFGGFLPSAFQPAGSYATTGANLFTGNQSVTGNLGVTGNTSATGTTTIGSGGTPIVQHLSMTFNPTFVLKTGAVCTSQVFTFTGVSDGNTVALGVPNERMTAADLIYSAWVSAANKVTIRACAFAGKPANFGTGAIRVDVWQH